MGSSLSIPYEGKAAVVVDPAPQDDWSVVLFAELRDLVDARLRHLTRLPAAFSGPIPVAVDVVILVDTSESMQCRFDAIETAIATLVHGLTCASEDPNRDGYRVGGAYNVVTSWRIKILGFHFEPANGAVALQERPFSADAQQVASELHSLKWSSSAGPMRPISYALASVCHIPAAEPGAVPSGSKWRALADAQRLAVVFSGGQDQPSALAEAGLKSLNDLAHSVHTARLRDITLFAPEFDSNAELSALNGVYWTLVSAS